MLDEGWGAAVEDDCSSEDGGWGHVALSPPPSDDAAESGEGEPDDAAESGEGELSGEPAPAHPVEARPD
eukprot:1105892-Pyramimonas_sp.AAC.1